MTAEHKHFKWDKLGLALSGLCLVHCLGTPFLLLLFPMFHGLDALHSSVHWMAAVLLIPMALYAVTQGYGHHRKKVVPLLAGMGSMLVLIGAFYPMIMAFLGHHHAHGHSHDPNDSCMTNEIIITSLGSVCLLICHGLNLWYCRKSKSLADCHSGH